MKISHGNGVISLIAFEHEMLKYDLYNKNFEVDYDGELMLFQESNKGNPFYYGKEAGHYKFRQTTKVSNIFRFGPIDIPNLDQLIELPTLYKRTFPCITGECDENKQSNMIETSVRARLVDAFIHEADTHSAISSVIKSVKVEKLHREAKFVLRDLGCYWNGKDRCFGMTPADRAELTV